MKVLVTGGTGFLGRHLVRALLERGYQVRVLIHHEADGLDGVELAGGDLTRAASLWRAVEGMDVIYHLAAIRDRWGLPYAAYQAVNVEGTRHLLEAAAGRVSRFVYCSSVGVLGHPGGLNIDESYPYAPGDGKYNYSHTKALAEQLALEYGNRLAVTIVRPVITYGPGDEWGMMTKLVTMLATGRFIPVGDGRNHLHLAYVSDTIQGLILAGESERAAGQTYIIAGPSPVSLNELLDKICAILDASRPRSHAPLALAKAVGGLLEGFYTLKKALGLEVGGESPFLTRDKVDTLTINRSFDISKACAELGYRPQVDYDRGLKTTIEWYRERGYIS